MCPDGASPSRLAGRRRAQASSAWIVAPCAKSRGKTAPPPPAASGRRGNRRNAPIAGEWGRPNRRRGRPASSTIAAAYSSRLRVRSMSSSRSRNRPPASRAARQPSSADRTCPRCRYPVGLGANRVTTRSAVSFKRVQSLALGRRRNLLHRANANLPHLGFKSAASSSIGSSFEYFTPNEEALYLGLREGQRNVSLC